MFTTLASLLAIPLQALFGGRRITQFAKKDKKSLWIVHIVYAAFLSLGLTVALTLVLGFNPTKVAEQIYQASLGSKFAISEMLLTALILVIIANGYAISFRTSWYIGAEGAYLLGNCVVVGVGLSSWITAFTPTTAILIMLSASIVTGALYSGLLAVIKIKRGVSEVFLSIMFTTIALGITNYLFADAWRWSTTGLNTARIPEEFWLPKIYGNTRLHFGLYIAIAVALLTRILLAYTTIGYRIDAVGKNPRAAKVNGINPARYTFISIAISGGLGGLAGGVNMLGLAHYLGQGVSKEYGITAILVAWVAGFEPLLIFPAAIMFSSLSVSGNYLQSALGVPGHLTEVIAYSLIFGIIISKLVNKE